LIFVSFHFFGFASAVKYIGYDFIPDSSLHEGAKRFALVNAIKKANIQ